MVPFSRVIVICFCVAALLCPYAVIAADSDYLKMLEGEVEELQLDQSGQFKGNEESVATASATATEDVVIEDWAWKGELEGDILPSGLNQDEFATILKQNFFGSFAFYRKLNSIDQETVYYHYTQASPANLEVIRQDIMDHFKR